MPTILDDHKDKLDSFVAGVNRIKAAAGLHCPTTVVMRSGKGKYLAFDNIEFDREDLKMEGVGTKRSVFCFIANEDSTTKSLGTVKMGDVMKPASFKVPAKHARGNILDEHNGLMGSSGKAPMQWTGPHYVR